MGQEASFNVLLQMWWASNLLLFSLMEVPLLLVSDCLGDKEDQEKTCCQNINRVNLVAWKQDYWHCKAPNQGVLDDAYKDQDEYWPYQRVSDDFVLLYVLPSIIFTSFFVASFSEKVVSKSASPCCY